CQWSLVNSDLSRGRGPNRRQGHLCGDLKTVCFECDQLTRMVRQNAHGVDFQSTQDLRSDAVFALFASRSDGLIRMKRLCAVKLEKADRRSLSAAHFVKVEKDAAAFGGDHGHGAVHLFMAVA